MRRRWSFVAVLAVLAGLGVAIRLDMSFDQSDAGYFLKPLFRGNDVFSLNLQEKHFVVTNPVGPVSVDARYGPFTVQQQVPASLLRDSLGNQSQLLGNMLVGSLEVTAHVVARTLVRDRPILQVLFHADHASVERRSSSNIRGEGFRNNSSNAQWCMQVHVVRSPLQELSSVCVLGDDVCLAEVTLPTAWWDSTSTGGDSPRNVDVYYSAFRADKNSRCSEANAGSSELIRRYVAMVTLTHGQVTYQELKEDHHILVYVPQASFYPGSRFRVPIKLQAESDLQVFAVRVKARRGIRVVGAETANADTWQLITDVNHRKHGAIVTALVVDRQHYSKTDRVQHVFDWIFEVDPDATGQDPGKLVFVLEYEMTLSNQEKYGSVANKVAARIQIQQDNTYAIVPVIKSTELLNTALLTGDMESLPLKIYSVSHSGQIGDITSQTTCHSGDEQVLKVAQACNVVYMDGSETRGATSVSVIAKYGRHTRFLFFRVWAPDFPLQIDLSDRKLSLIKGWKVPQRQRSYRKTRGVDFGLLTQPELLLDEESHNGDDASGDCRLRYQQSIVDVYARFCVPDGAGKQFLVHRKAMFRITDVLIDKLRVADSSIATLEGSIVQGVQGGRTEIQVLSRLGRVIGATELKVSTDRVTIEELAVELVTGISMSLSVEKEIPSMLVARIDRHTKLRRKYQEGVLDISVKFSDGSLMPLHHIRLADYFLDTGSLNSHLVSFGPALAPDTPLVVGLNQGAGELVKIALQLGDGCQRKKSRPLAVSYVYVNVDFSKQPMSPGMEVQNDAGQSAFNQQSGRNHYSYPEMVKNGDDGLLHVSVDGTHDESVVETGVKRVPSPRHQQARRLVAATGMTPLEVGMYVLLSVFCVAVVVFAVNCVIFVMRHHKGKRMPAVSDGKGKDAVSEARDWVWIGRETLQRNAVSTECEQRLMAETDFNGNRDESSAPSSNRNSSCSSERNSVVSTYKGSECSIRITANPMSDGVPGLPPPPVVGTLGARGGESNTATMGSDIRWDYEAMGMTYEQLMDYFDNLKESTA